MSLLRRHECCTSTQQTAVSTVSRARSRACASTITKQQTLVKNNLEARRVVRSSDSTWTALRQPANPSSEPPPASSRTSQLLVQEPPLSAKPSPLWWEEA